MASNSEKVRLIFGLKLRQLRHDKGIQLNELAERAGFSVSYLNEIEKGKKYPKSDKIFALAKALDTDYDTLVSMKVSKKLEPIAELLNSNILQELPLELFGIEPSDLLELLSEAPSKVSSFIHTIIEITRNYGMNVEQFYFSALRSYQEMHENYFEELELAADRFLTRYATEPGQRLDHIQLKTILETEFGYVVETYTEADKPELTGLRSVMVPGSPHYLLINQNMEPEQVSFTYARELGYSVMGLKNRPLISSVVEAESFEHVLNNFKASYFAEAILISKQELIRGMEVFFKQPTWQPQVLLDLMYSFQATPEVFLHRLSHMMTSHFGINQLFFLRLDNAAGEDHYELTKEMHIASLHNPHGTINEHYCRRWVSVTILQKLALLQKTGQWDGKALCDTQVEEYMDTNKQYWVVTMAKPSPPKEVNSSVSLGFAVDDRLRSLVRFLNDDYLNRRLVNETCERCGALACLERSHPPVIWQRMRRNEALKETLQKLRSGLK
jgi:hypothetical protein